MLLFIVKTQHAQFNSVHPRTKKNKK